MKIRIISNKKENIWEWLAKKTKRGAIIALSLISSIFYVVVSLIAGKIQEISRPYLIKLDAPEFVYNSFTLYATIFIVISYINKNIFKKIAELELSLDETTIDEEEFKKFQSFQENELKHEAEVARLNKLICSKDRMIDALLSERQADAEMAVYNKLPQQKNENRIPKIKTPSSFVIKYTADKSAKGY